MKDIFNDNSELYLDKSNKKLGGVCSAVARYLDVPKTGVRVAAVIGVFIHAPSVLIAYGLAYLILNDEPEGYSDVLYDDGYDS